MPMKPIIVPPGYMPPIPFTTFGKTCRGELSYTVSRPFPRKTLTLIYRDGVEEPEDFAALFKLCAGEKEEP